MVVIEPKTDSESVPILPSHFQRFPVSSAVFQVPKPPLHHRVPVPILPFLFYMLSGTVFAYGVTSSGKTHTMHGDQNSPGIIPLAIKDVFSIIQDTPGREFLLRVSYLEIYNEVINDLLDPTGQNLRVREDSQGSSSISSADFFGHDTSDSLDLTAADLINRLSFQAFTIGISLKGEDQEKKDKKKVDPAKKKPSPYVLWCKDSGMR